MKSGEKTIWTERKLQDQQKELFTIFKTCGWKDSKLQEGPEGANIKVACLKCKNKQCYPTVLQMHNLLAPYATSIFKRHFKHRSTLEEFDRVVTEGVNSLLMDVWERGKVIEKSFGKMVYWKMVYFLDGKINLFDKENVQSLDQMTDEFETSNSYSNGEDLVEYFNNVFKDGTVNLDGYQAMLEKDTIKVIIGLMDSYISTFSRFTPTKYKYAHYLRALHGVKRFFEKRDNTKLFEGKPKAFFYYNKLLDVIFSYLETYKRLN